jgi:uncharacterized protein involved in exopolysaccharide biosynthesis
MTLPTPNHSIVARWWRVLRARWRVGLGIYLVVVVLAALLVLRARPIWRAEASLRMGASAPMSAIPAGGAGASGLFAMFQQMSGDPFANELELLSSRTVVEGVVADNALNVALVAPRGWTRDSLMLQIKAGRQTQRATYDITWTDAGVHVQRTTPTDSVMGIVQPAQPIQFDDVTVAFRAYRSSMPRTIQLHTVAFGEALRRAQSRLVAQRKRREANLVRLSYDDPDPGLALNVLTAAGQRYGELRARLQRRESGQTVDSLDVVANRTLAQLQSEEKALEDFQRASRMVSPEVQGEAFVKHQSDVLAALGNARNELARADEIMRHLDAQQDASLAWSGLVADPVFVRDLTLGALLTNMLNLQQERLALSGRRTGEDPQMQNLDKQIAYLDNSLRNSIRDYRNAVASQYRLLTAQAAVLDSSLLRIPGGVMELARRQRSVKLLSDVYLFTNQRARQEDLRDALSFADIQVVDPPAVRYKPIWPRKKFGLAVGVLLGLVFGTLGMALREAVGDRRRDDDDGASQAPRDRVLAGITESENGSWR